MGPWGFIIPFSFLPHVFEIFYNKKLKTKNELLLLERRLGQLFLSAWEHGGGPGGLEPVCQRRRPSQLSLSLHLNAFSPLASAMRVQVDTGQTLFYLTPWLFSSGLGGHSWDSPFFNLQQ